MRDDLTAHILACPMRARLDAVEDFVTAYKAKTGEDKTWMDRLWPAIYAAAGVTVYVAALHASDLLNAMKP